LIPDLSQMPKNDLADCGAAVDRRQAVQIGLVERVEDLTKDIELNLVSGIVTDADRPRAFVAGQPRHLPFLQATLAAAPVHDLEIGGITSGGAQEPVAPCDRLVPAAAAHESLKGLRGVAQPAVPVVPVARASECLGQRRRRRSDDPSGRVVGERL
jgi:hypothetical protein